MIFFQTAVKLKTFFDKDSTDYTNQDRDKISTLHDKFIEVRPQLDEIIKLILKNTRKLNKQSYQLEDIKRHTSPSNTEIV